MLEGLSRTDGLRFVTCRFGTIFGSSVGMRFHTAVNRFIWQACTGRPLTVWRTAMRQKRPYLELGDAVRALSFILNRSVFDNRVYNVLTTNATVSDILDVIWLYVPEARVEYVDSPIMNQLSYTVSNRRFRELGFRFSGSLWQSIGDAVKLFDGLYRPGAPQMVETACVNATT
jgi:nucleoside-diphosphate-sugar epimerase